MALCLLTRFVHPSGETMPAPRGFTGRCWFHRNNNALPTLGRRPVHLLAFEFVTEDEITTTKHANVILRVGEQGLGAFRLGVWKNLRPLLSERDTWRYDDRLRGSLNGRWKPIRGNPCDGVLPPLIRRCSIESGNAEWGLAFLRYNRFFSSLIFSLIFAGFLWLNLRSFGFVNYALLYSSSACFEKSRRSR